MFDAVQQAVTFADKHDAWVVVVTPLQGVGVARKHLSTMVRPGDRYGGRTLIRDRGRVSVVEARSPVFVPDGTPFHLHLVGWDEKAVEFKEIPRWREAAKSEIGP